MLKMFGKGTFEINEKNHEIKEKIMLLYFKIQLIYLGEENI